MTSSPRRADHHTTCNAGVHIGSCWLLLLVLYACLPAGCSKEKLKEIADGVQTSGENFVKESRKMTDSLVRDSEPEAPETGHMTMKSESPISFESAYVQMHVVGDGRMNSLQITSYSPDLEFTPAPAVFIHATTKIETVPLAAGKTIPCNVFIETRRGAAIARNPIGKPIPVVFGSMNMQEKTINVTVPACTLDGSDDKPVAIDGIDIHGVVLED